MFITLRHNELRDFFTVDYNVRIEPQLKPLRGEVFNYKSSNTPEHARVGVSARSFLMLGQTEFSDLRVFNPLVNYSIYCSLVSFSRKKNVNNHPVVFFNNLLINRKSTQNHFGLLLRKLETNIRKTSNSPDY